MSVNIREMLGGGLRIQTQEGSVTPKRTLRDAAGFYRLRREYVELIARLFKQIAS